MKTSSAALLGEKSLGLLQDLAFLSKDLILLAQACELLADILMRTSSKSACACSDRHRLNVDFATPRSFAIRSAAPAGHRQPHGLAFELIRETPLFVPAHSHLLYPS
jgi:hypothetical protein